MREVAAEVASWRAAGERVALATVVGVTGSAPRPAGATLAATTGARIAGSVSNGCVEAAVYEECMAALDRKAAGAGNAARVVRYGISDELAFTVGLSCGGAIDVLVEPLGPLHERALAAIARERAVVLARIVAPADRVGTVLVVTEDDPPGQSFIASERTGASEPPIDVRSFGDEPSGELAAIGPQARAALLDGRSRTVALPLVGGREAAVFLEAVPTPPMLVIVGATHVAVTLARLAGIVGFRVVVADPRAALASRERFPAADEIVLAWPDEAVARLRITRRTAIALLSHDPKFDRPGLTAALRSAAGYIGAIGSRRTNEERFAWLRAQGFGDADLERLRAPIGLDIGAATAEETALAVLAEIVAVAHARAGSPLSGSALAAVG
jgi:xanthine dehydrogenase accessory factor